MTEIQKMIRRLMKIQIINGDTKENDEAIKLGHQIVVSGETTMAQKRFAMRRMDEVLGTNMPVSQDDVLDYLSHYERDVAESEGKE